MVNPMCSEQNSDEEQKIARRTFIQYSASITTSSLVVGAIAMKTDALAQPVDFLRLRSDEDPMPYQYLPLP